MLIRELNDDDWPALWRFMREIIAAGETFAYDPGMSEREARAMWVIGAPARTVVAVSDDGVPTGTANMYANRQGGGAHIASGSLMVDPACWGRGVGRALTEDMISWATLTGFRGLEFNAVVESNRRAVALYRAVGFEILGTVPAGFLHPADGYVGLHLMFRGLA